MAILLIRSRVKLLTINSHICECLLESLRCVWCCVFLDFELFLHLFLFLACIFIFVNKIHVRKRPVTPIPFQQRITAYTHSRRILQFRIF